MSTSSVVDTFVLFFWILVFIHYKLQVSAHIELTKKLPIGWCCEFVSMFA